MRRKNWVWSWIRITLYSNLFYVSLAILNSYLEMGILSSVLLALTPLLFISLIAGIILSVKYIHNYSERRAVAIINIAISTIIIIIIMAYILDVIYMVISVIQSGHADVTQ